MKKLFLGVGILTLMGLSACDDKNETVIVPGAEDGTLTFELYTPESAEPFYTLLEEDGNKVIETLTFAKPDYGFSAIPTYTVQVSLESDFKADNTILLESTSTTESVGIVAKELNSAITKLHAKGEYPEITEPQHVFVRIQSVISKASNGVINTSPVVKPIYSNSIEMQVLPYEIQNVALPATYYIIGLGGKWDNSPAAVGTENLIPMSLVADFAYDPATGKGEFVYTGYFKATDSFKLVGTPGDWGDAWGMADGKFVYGSGDNISVPTNGYYRITLNTETTELSMEAVELEFTPYKWIEMVGDFSGWDAAPLKMTTIESTDGTVWTALLTLEENSGLKFRADGDWSNNWGGKSFPYGFQPSGDNIPAVAGSYRVVFNVLDNSYFFFAQ